MNYSFGGLTIDSKAAKRVYRAQRGRDAIVSFRRWKKTRTSLPIRAAVPLGHPGACLSQFQGPGSSYKTQNSQAICAAIR